MADFTTLGVSKNDQQAICGKMDLYVSLDRKSSTYATVGVVSNESEFLIDQKSVTYDDGFNPWLEVTVQELLSMKLSLMQAGVAKLIAIATGRPSISSTSSLYQDVLFSDTIPTKPYMRAKMVGQTVGGKAVEIELMKVKVAAETKSFKFGISGPAEVPLTLKAYVDSASTTGYKVGRYRVAI